MKLLALYAGQTPAECWRAREEGKFARGEYMAASISLPWYRCGMEDTQRAVKAHYCHVSVEDPSKIAFTPSERHGREDRQVRMKPGKYLRKFYSTDLSENEITEYARKFAATNEKVDFQLAETADEIEEVYTDGPHSCMSNSASVRAYAGHGLAVAYITGKDGDPTARAVCWPEKSIFARIYGDESRLLSSLLRAGYRRAGSQLRDQAPGEARGNVPRAPDFEGATLDAEQADSGWVCPWFDFSPNTVGPVSTPEGTVLRVSRGGEFTANSTEGVIGGRLCEHCNEHCSDEESYYVSEQNWCESCYESYGFHCEQCEESYHTDDSREVHADRDARHSYTQYWCTGCAGDDAEECEECNKLYCSDGIIGTENGTVLCKECADEKLTCCERCDSTVEIDETRPVLPEGEARDTETWCNSCAGSDSRDCKNCDNRFAPAGDEWRCEECGPEEDSDDTE